VITTNKPEFMKRLPRQGVNQFDLNSEVSAGASDLGDQRREENGRSRSRYGAQLCKALFVVQAPSTSAQRQVISTHYERGYSGIHLFEPAQESRTDTPLL